MGKCLDFPDGPKVITRVLKQGRGRQKRTREVAVQGGLREVLLILKTEEEAMTQECQPLWEAGEGKRMASLLELPEGTRPRQHLILAQCDAFQMSTSRTARK